MDRDFRQGYIQVDFPVERFQSAPRLLLRSAALFFSNLGFLAALTLAVFLPGKLLLQFCLYLADVPTGGVLSYLLMDFTDLILGSLVIPAAMYGLVGRLRTGRVPAAGECLRWGRRQWLRMFGYNLAVEITVALYGALLIVPGVMAMVRLVLVSAIVAIEADREQRPLARSSELSKGHRWQIFLVLLPVMVIELVFTFLVLGRVENLLHSRIALALGDALFSVGGQWMTAIELLLYLGLVEPVKPEPAKRSR